MAETAGITIVPKGSYAEVQIQLESTLHKLLIDERNLTLVMLQAREALAAMRRVGKAPDAEEGL